MKKPTPRSAAAARRKKRLWKRRIAVIALLLVIVLLLAAIGWLLIRSLTEAVSTGDEPVSGSPSTTAAETTTTTAKPTYPTIAVTAPLTTPRIVLYDVTHDTVLYSKDADERCYPASLTKLLTATVATELCGPEEEFTVGTELSLVQPLSSLANLQQGYRLTRDMILDALLLPSGNDAAYVIAAHLGRKIAEDDTLSDVDAVRVFVNRMNDELIEIGATSSHFSNPDGYYSPDHYTTANDMLLIAKNAMQYDNIREAVAKTSVSYVLPSGQSVSWTNSNELIDPSSPYYFEGATGMKTGFTNEAGHCVVASATRDGAEMIAVVMGGLSADQRWSDAVALLNEAFAAEASHQ
ncbi:MAG TPA: D-alanyl-D-alanine carboxypeptidase [Firmicutes bacterium]|nr:D-alanyl-D-alanine carboxypeptidase [Bacillota bacterium]